MSSSAAKWREEQVLVICPGSRTTMAQLGCSELTPPLHRIPTRMFRDGDEWRPYHTFSRTKVVDGVEQEEWVEDVDSDEGATYPMKGGRIVEMDAFLAFLDHVHGLLTTTYHNTPIMLMASPQWTRPDCEAIARYIFEKTRTPSLCLLHSGLATQYGLKWPNMTVVDIGYEKVDVTAIHDGRVVSHMDLGSPTSGREISGGEVFTKKLLGLLEGKGFTYDMAEQLKKSAICEVLPYASEIDGLAELPKKADAPLPNSTSATANAPLSADAYATAASKEGPEASRPTAADAEAGEEGADGGADDDGVLDVAKIVTTGQTKEFLAKKEKEKGKPGRKPKNQETEPPKPVRLPNSKRIVNTFWFEEIVQEEVPPEPKQKPNSGTVESLSNEGAVPEAATAPVPAPTPALEAPAPTTDANAQPSTDATNGEVPKTEEEEPVKPTDAAPVSTDVDNPMEDAQPAAEQKPAETNGEVKDTVPASEPKPTPVPTPADASTGVTEVFTSSVPEPEPKPAEAAEPAATNEPPEMRPKRIRRDIEVGLERFTFADRSEIDRIVSTIYRTVQGIDDMYMRPACWDNLVFVGNGSRLRGLRDNILQTLHARHLVSPSTATMFTSELPSNMATPTGTGSQTPTGSFTGAPHQLSSSGVNPLLQAATTASSLGVGAAAAATPQAGSDAAGPTGHHFHSQTPTSIKTPNLPTYLGEWTKNGFEEAMFLGAQVAARIAFCLHSNLDANTIEAQRLMSLNRVDYNELGPKGIRTHSMLS